MGSMLGSKSPLKEGWEEEGVEKGGGPGAEGGTAEGGEEGREGRGVEGVVEECGRGAWGEGPRGERVGVGRSERREGTVERVR